MRDKLTGAALAAVLVAFLLVQFLGLMPAWWYDLINYTPPNWMES